MKVMISQPMNGRTEEQIRKERKKVVEKLERIVGKLKTQYLQRKHRKNVLILLYII